MSKMLCSHELYGMYHERWSAIKRLESDVDFVNQLDQLLHEMPDVGYCSWFDDTQEVNRRLLRRLAKMEESERIS